MGRKRGFDEATVLDVVRDQFWTTGFAGTSTYDLMDATGLGKGSIYKAFGNKHDLYVRVFSDYCQDLVAQAREQLRGGPRAVLPSPMARLERYLVTLARTFAGESPHRGCFLTKVTADRAGEDEKVAQTARRAFDDLAGTFAATIRDAQDAGEVAEHVDSSALGYLMLSVIRGIDSIAKADVDGAMLERTARSAVALIPRTDPPRTEGRGPGE
ncbi:TetR/AcrR family transcriptional regulator [Streptomyces sp. NPDC048448]|uniref:TetR/AcrR family transcriptional regulator n=1 Tax=Streptomyces kaempferi TaxID=333725 RepID=A0ABW3XJR6_9ACTN|nr:MULTISPECIES: TetR/AcrR family transcriptional regulator [unclassified Streptomyces]QIY65219.1 TetR/AcrR family transcriptional regulator [Streptomyces sp. RPA4-2]